MVVARKWITPPRLISFVVLASVLLAAAWFFWHIARPGPSLIFLVPDGYTGYLLTRWECRGGELAPRNAMGAYGNHLLAFTVEGTACLADAISRGGFRVLGLDYANGTPAPVIVGGARGLQGSLSAGQMEFVS